MVDLSIIRQLLLNTTVDNGGEVTKQSVEANAFDVTVKVPITTSKKMAVKTQNE